MAKHGADQAKSLADHNIPVIGSFGRWQTGAPANGSSVALQIDKGLKMNVWRPQQSIQFKALGLVWRDGCLLATEIHRDDGSVKGVRPLGGMLEFGETWRDALVREFEEELQIQIDVVGTPMFLENIYTHHGMVGHELVVLSDVLFPDRRYHDQDVIVYSEDNGERCRARWFDPDTLDCGGLDLYPNGLKMALAGRQRNP